MIPRPLRPGLFAAVAAVLLAPATHAVAGDPPLDEVSRDFDQVQWVIRVTPDIPAGTVDGETTVRFASLADPLKV
ncbi:MAG TPA: hypothetical protein VFS92_06370, partial [Planctomycetota bacterium]|nr:hypothetical protein [Planctomycetota bacterium]